MSANFRECREVFTVRGAFNVPMLNGAAFENFGDFVGVKPAREFREFGRSAILSRGRVERSEGREIFRRVPGSGGNFAPSPATAKRQKKHSGPRHPLGGWGGRFRTKPHAGTERSEVDAKHGTLTESLHARPARTSKPPQPTRGGRKPRPKHEGNAPDTKTRGAARRGGRSGRAAPNKRDDRKHEGAASAFGTRDCISALHPDTKDKPYFKFCRCVSSSTRLSVKSNVRGSGASVRLIVSR